MTHPLSEYIEFVPDFPRPGITFRDITKLLGQKFPETIDSMLELINPEDLKEATAFAGIDARGFVFAAAMAARTDKNVILIRKEGKLPPPVISADYSLEYGIDRIEIRQQDPSKIILVDDVLATGGTLQAAADICVKAGHEIKALITLIDMKFLNEFSWNGMQAKSLIEYEK